MSHLLILPAAGEDPATALVHWRADAIGLGTFGSDHASAPEVAEAVRGAAMVGYRHFDCAAVYTNEYRIGQVFSGLFSAGLRRDELWITSKLWNDKHGEEDVIPACRKSIADLRAGYLDTYLVHWPFPNSHPPGCTVESRSPDAKPYIHENFMRTWRRMERLVDMGLVRHTGTSNMTIPKLRLLLRDARIKPAVNEMEIHPHFQQPELFEFVRTNRIEPVGYCPPGISQAARARLHSRRYLPFGRSRDRADRTAARCPSCGGVPEVGRGSAGKLRFRSLRIRGTTWPICRRS
jgi:diketogulonate reductase-like aldo/keto reductase